MLLQAYSVDNKLIIITELVTRAMASVQAVILFFVIRCKFPFVRRNNVLTLTTRSNYFDRTISLVFWQQDAVIVGDSL